jgi:2-polyprenyl-6-methoxyphenol hydroxylase-like FAD-dependent oxidoreductase
MYGEGAMRHKGLRVRIIGAGTGGPCLAQGLKQDDVEVEAFERDHGPRDRLQGYRLSIKATGRRALEACLPERLFAKLIANCAKPSDSVAFLDHHLNRLLVIDLPHGDRDDPDSELPVSRIALRSILSEGLTPFRTGPNFRFRSRPSSKRTLRSSPTAPRWRRGHGLPDKSTVQYDHP